MLTFNNLLALDGVDMGRMRVIRNHDGRLGRGRVEGDHTPDESIERLSPTARASC